MIDLTAKSGPLSTADALHLLRRATLHPSWAVLSVLPKESAASAVDYLLGLGSVPPPPAWANTKPEFTNFADAAKLWPELQSWWTAHVLKGPSLRERMVMLWHNTFVTDYITVYAGQWMVKQSVTIRENAYDYRALSNKMVGDPAILRYLNGDQSIKGNPNENFAREWFELFSMGIGNYTEQDIVEAAKAFTGWRVIGLEGVYSAQLADQSEKTIFGVTKNFNAEMVVDLTLQQAACSRFIAKKLLIAFVESQPDAESIQQVADLVKQHDFNLNPVVRTILVSKGFYHPDLRGALIKSPTDLVVGLASLLNAKQLDPSYATMVMRGLTQEPFYPPTVEGWKGHHAWITSSTFPQRQRYAESFIDGRVTFSSTKITDADGKVIVIDLVAFAKQLPDNKDAAKLVTNIAQLMLAMPISTEQHKVLLDIMMAGAPVYEWDIDNASASVRLKFLIQAIVRMPEFQLL